MGINTNHRTKSRFDWDEVAGTSLREIRPPKPDRFRSRLFFLFSIMVLLFALLVLRLAQLSLVQHDSYLDRSTNTTLRQVIYPAPRGSIYDRDGFLLASDRQALDIQIVLSEFNSDLSKLAGRISSACKVPFVETEQKLKLLADRAAIGEDLGHVLLEQATSEKAALGLAEKVGTSSGVAVRQVASGDVPGASGPAYDLYIDPAVAFRKRSQCLASLAGLLGISPSDVLKRVHAVEGRVERTPWLVDYVALPLYRGVSLDVIAGVETDPGTFPGIVPAKRFRREYTLGSRASHLLGYVGMPEEDDLEHIRKYQVERIRPLWKYVEELNPLVGKSGVEAFYDDLLQGRAGTALVEVDVRNRLQRIIISEQSVTPTPGQDLHLTIKATYQEAAEEALLGKRGAIVVMDPWTGELLALASSPDYDPNDLIPPVSEASYREYSKNTASPFLNRATMGLYPPASVFKVVVAIAALEEGKLAPSSSYNCQGSITVGDSTFHCWAPHGDVCLAEAIENSCNVFFFRTGLLLGPDPLAKWAGKLGFGERTGLDLPVGAEKPGLVPSRQWKIENMNPDESSWYAADTLNLSIGQGYLQVTPLQVTVMMAAIANGGVVVTPHLLMSGDWPEKRVIPFRQETLNTVRAGLEDVVDSGTASRAGLRAFQAAGKTGTGEVGGGQESHAWFSGYAPRGRPQVVITVVIEHGGAGGENAAPVAAQVLTEIFPGDG